MKQLHATDTPDWPRFFGAVITIAFFVLLFGCERTGDPVMDNWWMLALVSLIFAGIHVSIRHAQKLIMPQPKGWQALTFFFAVLFGALFLMPYIFGVVLQIITRIII